MNENQVESGTWGKPGSAKAWFRKHAVTGADDRARMIIQLLGLGHLADPALDREVDDALVVPNQQAPALDQLPVLNANEPEGITRWCRYVLSQPADQAIALSQPLHPVMGKLTDDAAIAVGRVLR